MSRSISKRAWAIKVGKRIYKENLTNLEAQQIRADLHGTVNDLRMVYIKAVEVEEEYED